MSKMILFFSLIFSGFCSAVNVAVDIPKNIFLFNGNENLDSILFDNDEIEDAVKTIFNADLLSHEYTKAFDENSKFELYWSKFSNKWKAVDLDRDGINEIIFSGKTSAFDDKDYVEIYQQTENDYALMFGKSGVLLGYKMHPNTKEIILYHHKYPCCKSASHNIFRIRKINDKLKIKDSFFASRDANDMKGQFYPEKIDFEMTYNTLQVASKVYWSNEIIIKDAWPQKSITNEIVEYPKNSVFKVISREENMSYVIFCTPPSLVQSKIINAANFEEKRIYCWIENSKLK